MEDVARQILGYFVRNPNTVDTLDGIARWRLLEAMVRQSVEDTAKGVQVLVQQGFLDEEEVPGMAPLFRLIATTCASSVVLKSRSPSTPKPRLTSPQHAIRPPGRSRR